MFGDVTKCILIRTPLPDKPPQLLKDGPFELRLRTHTPSSSLIDVHPVWLREVMKKNDWYSEAESANKTTCLNGGTFHKIQERLFESGDIRFLLPTAKEE